jgi:hypothetical protein
MALNIDGNTGISGVDGSSSAPAIKGTDGNTGINFGADIIDLNTGGSSRFKVGAAGQLGIAGANYGTAGQALLSQGASAAPQWGTVSSGAGGSSNVSFNSGNGIDFSATSDASGMSSELLDDYEEGTWTPQLQRSSGATQSTYVNNTGTYTKIGRVVIATVNFYTTSGIGGSGNYHLSIPIAADTSSNGSSCSFVFSRLYLGNGDYAGGVSAHTFEIVSGTSYCRLRNIDNNSQPTSITGNSFLVIGRITYFAAT